jgi:hypothetical protein
LELWLEQIGCKAHKGNHNSKIAELFAGCLVSRPVGLAEIA